MREAELSKIIKKLLLEDFKSNNRKGLYSVTQKMMAYNSNKIEGSTLTSEQTASLFDTGTIVSNGIEVYRAKDIEEMTGHFKMFNLMLKRIDEPLSADLIKAYVNRSGNNLNFTASFTIELKAKVLKYEFVFPYETEVKASYEQKF